MKLGQRVIAHAFALLTGDLAEAAFQLFTLVPANMVAPVPDDMSFATAAVLPLSVYCDAAELYQNHSLAIPLPSARAEASGKSILIWGGSSSVGSSAIQLAHASGLEVIATSSPKNFGYVKGLGAAAVFDYTSSDTVSQLVNALKGSQCVGAFDTVGQAIPQCVELIKQLGGGHIVATSDPPEELPAGVTANHGELLLLFSHPHMMSGLTSIVQYLQFPLKITRSAKSSTVTIYQRHWEMAGSSLSPNPQSLVKG